jgi:hypothetical protein
MSEDETPPTPKGVARYLASIGKRGGSSGTGDAKRRGDSSHYSELSKKRWAAKKKADAAAKRNPG